MTLIDVQGEGHNQEFVKNDSQKLLNVQQEMRMMNRTLEDVLEWFGFPMKTNPPT